MRARWRRARSWKPSFPQEVIITWAYTLAAAFLAGATTAATIGSVHDHHTARRVAQRSEGR